MSIDRADVTAAAVLVTRWRRYGHDRAYVKIGDRDVGYRDLKTGDVRCERAQEIELVEAATADLFATTSAARRAADYRPRHSRDESAVDPAPVGEPAPAAGPEAAAQTDHVVTSSSVPASTSDFDLAANRPGQAAREKARELRDGRPVRTLLARAVGARTDERAWRIGADGEGDVARQLARMGHGWHVLHAVPVGERGSDIDHVVIGPGGVFTINTKNHPGAKVWVAGTTMKINGFDQPYIRNSTHEAARAARLLTNATGMAVAARGVVAVVGVKRALTIKEPPKDVTVLRRNDLLRYLGDAPQVLDDAAVTRIYEAARHLSTWRPRSVTRQEFDAIA